MNYKCMTLAVLLLPISCYSKGNEARIKELKELQYKKSLELSALRKIIVEIDTYLRWGRSNFYEFVNDTAHNKNERLNSIKKLGQEATNELINQKNVTICSNFINALLGKQELIYSVCDEVYDMENIGSYNILDIGKFFVISSSPEKELMLLSLEKYEKALKELIAINKELFSLEK